MRFEFSLECSVSLTVEQVWPDGDAPASPTAEDVAAVVRAAGGVREVLREWGLEYETTLTISGGSPPGWVEIGGDE